MQILGLSLPLLKPGDDLPTLILRGAERIGGLRDGDVVVVASKALATAQGRVVDLAKIRPSTRARRLASQTKLEPEFVELVLRETDRVLGACEGAILTIKNGLLCANAGVDQSNAPPGCAVLMLADPNKAARELKEKLVGRAKTKIALIVADSSVKPLRMGTVGQAIGIAGFEPVLDCRGQRDLYGRPLRMTFRAIADQLATAAQLVMGEAAERVPITVVRGANVKLTEKPRGSPKIPPDRCIYRSSLRIPKK